MMRPSGIVYLVGAGPGDPGLITVRGQALLRSADVVIHDRLVVRELLAQARPDAEIIDAGKRRGDRTSRQPTINRLLIEHAARGQTVVRLKGGDPFVFGRGFEELRACRDAGIDCVVVPGVSSAIAAPAACGIPVTLRGVARSFAVLTAEAAETGDCTMRIPVADTIVLLMGRDRLAELTRRLLDDGWLPTTPAACVERATLPDQRVVAGPLGMIAEQADQAGLQPPMVLVVGETAAHADCSARSQSPLRPENDE
ncbi:MAG: uroporphyrinogen-III C-methyltransferase [Planctomycetota bacterium]